MLYCNVCGTKRPSAIRIYLAKLALHLLVRKDYLGKKRIVLFSFSAPLKNHHIPTNFYICIRIFLGTFWYKPRESAGFVVALYCRPLCVQVVGRMIFQYLIFTRWAWPDLIAWENLVFSLWYASSPSMRLGAAEYDPKCYCLSMKCVCPH